MILTKHKKFIDLLDFKKEDYTAKDAAYSLARIVRYNGHGTGHYSVARHSINAMEIAISLGANVPTQFFALMHDVTEVYVGDMPGPLKKIKFPEFAKLEDEIMGVILSFYGDQFNCDNWTKYIDYEIVKTIDKSLLLPEMNQIMPDKPILMNLGPVYTIPLGLVSFNGSPLDDSKDWANMHDQSIKAMKEFLNAQVVTEEIPF